MIAEIKTCKSCERRFTIRPEDFNLYKKVGIPPSKECRRCRWRHQLAFWTFGKFRKTKSDLSGKTIITVLPESAGFPIYARNEWVSDAWDPMDYGKEYDFSRSFFEQFGELRAGVPHSHQQGVKNVNCEWCDDVWKCRDCYLCRAILGSEYLSYSYRAFGCKNSIDLAYCFDSELSYDCLYCFKCYRVKYSFDARNCMESMFLYDCRNVQHCFMCWNLRNKKYYILNKPYSKEKYFERLKEYDTRSYKKIQKFKKEFNNIIAREAVHRENFNVKVTNSAGNFLNECKNCFSCYFLEKSENCRYIFRGIENKDVIDSVGIGMVEKSAMSIGINCYDAIVNVWCSNCRHSAYLEYCEDCESCFGCVGLRKKKHCILNKQYTEDEYKKLTSKIKEQMKQRGEWGLFLPYSFAYSGYNLTLAQWYFPKTKEDIEKIGGRWDNIRETTYEGMSGGGLPDRIDDVKDDITGQAIICPETGWRFNIARHELAFYKEHGIPLPHYHPDWRTRERFKPLTVLKSYRGSCIFCSRRINHFYPRKRGYRKIMCADCYQSQIS